MLVSVIIRTYNEAKHLPEILNSIKVQSVGDIAVETVIVDSGSTDETLRIAEQFDTNIVHIKKEEFTFGRSLNYGCEAARGEYPAILSGHCIPCDEHWLTNLIKPLMVSGVAYVYGGQVGNDSSRFSEKQLFKKNYPQANAIPKQGIFCNNANSALLKEVWDEYKFDEDLTGLEDMELAKRLVNNDHKIGYVGEAPVFHLHEETWHKVKIRFEREAVALQHIMPEVHVSFLDFLRYLTTALQHDFVTALKQRKMIQCFSEIVMFRLMQYWGTYRGNHEHRKLSSQLKEEYFYPR